MPRKPHFGRTVDDYLGNRPPFSAQLYARLASFGVGRHGQSILDLGAGTGHFSNPLAQRGSTVIAVDISECLLAHAKAPRIIAAAELLPFADRSLDVVTAAQCWHWFDRTRAPNEIFRVLKPGGTLAVVYQTYVPLPGSIAERTEKLILKSQPSWRHANSTGINGQVLRDVQIAGFREIESSSFDVEIPFSRESWAGFIRTISAVGASMPAPALAAFEVDHQNLLKTAPPTFTVPHRVFVVVTKRPAGL